MIQELAEAAPAGHHHLAILEAEAISVIRTVASEAERPVLLFSGGKDSLVLLHLARKAFYPAIVPFPLLHVDTGHNFPEVLATRDEVVSAHRLQLLVASVPELLARGVVEERPGESRNRLQIPALLGALAEHRFDAAFGGARRDEERARAKERFVSFRDRHGQWEPRRQRPELWGLYNTRVAPGEGVRVFPLSNWTELDVWLYLRKERIALPTIYFAHEREVFEREGMLYAVGEFVRPTADERVERRRVRYRTVGDMTCTAAVESAASTFDDVLREVLTARVTERGSSRADDLASAAAMEDRKREGYF